MVDRIATLEAEELAEKPYNAADPTQVAEARKTQGRKKVKDREDYLSLMEHENGRRFLWQFCAVAITGNPVVPGDLYSTYFNLGQESKARAIFTELIRLTPELATKMIQENIDKK